MSGRFCIQQCNGGGGPKTALRSRTLTRPRRNEQTKRHDSPELSPEKNEYVGSDPDGRCARQRISQRGQGKNHGTEGANQRNLNSPEADKDKAADNQGAEHHHEHCAIDCKAKERDRSCTADRKLKLKFIRPPGADRRGLHIKAKDALPNRNMYRQRNLSAVLGAFARQGHHRYISVQRIVAHVSFLQIEVKSDFGKLLACPNLHVLHLPAPLNLEEKISIGDR